MHSNLSEGMNERLMWYETQGKLIQRKEIIGERIKLLREKNKLSQKEVSEIIGITPAAYNSYEKGQNSPKVETIVFLSVLYNVTSDFILGISDDYDVVDFDDNFAIDKYEAIQDFKEEIQEIKLRMKDFEKWMKNDKQSTSE